MASTVPQTLSSSQRDAQHSCLTLHNPQGEDSPCGHSFTFTFSLTKGLNTWKMEKRSRGFSSLTVQSVGLKHLKLLNKEHRKKDMWRGLLSRNIFVTTCIRSARGSCCLEKGAQTRPLSVLKWQEAQSRLLMSPRQARQKYCTDLRVMCNTAKVGLYCWKDFQMHFMVITL